MSSATSSTSSDPIDDLTRCLLQQAPDSIFISDASGHLVEVNAHGCTLTGFAHDALLGRSLRDLFDAEVATQILKQGAVTLIVTLHCAGEVERPVETTAQPLADGRLVLMVRDPGLPPSTNLLVDYRSLFTQMEEGFALHDIICDATGRPIDYRFLEVNPAFERLTGLRRAELIGRTVREVLPQTEDYWIERYGAVALTGVPQRFEDYFRELDRYYAIYAYRPRLQQFAVIFSDVSSYRRVEADLRASEARYLGLFENMLNGFAYCRMLYENDQPSDFIYLRVNAAFERLTGLHGVSHRKVTEVIPGIREDNPEIFEVYGRVIATGQAEQFETYLSTLGLWLAISVYRPAAEHFIAIFENITERKQAEQVLSRRVAQLALLSEVGREITSALEAAQVLDLTARLIHEKFGYHWVGLFVLDRERQELLLRGRAGKFMHLFAPDHRLAFNSGMVGWAARHNCPLLANDVRREPSYVNAYGERLPTQSELSLPLSIADEVFGVLDLQSPQLNAFDEIDVQTMETLARQVAIALHNARLYQAAQQALQERERADQIMLARLRLIDFADTHTLLELLQATLDEAEQLTESQLGFYHFVEADQRTLSLQAWSTRAQRQIPRMLGLESHYPVNEAGIWADCIRERRPVIHNEYVALPHRHGVPEGHEPLVRDLAVPIMRSDRIVGVLGVANKPQAYTQTDLETLAKLADLAWDISERKRSLQALQESELQLKRSQEVARVGHWTWDITTNRVTCSEEMYRIFGVAPSFEILDLEAVIRTVTHPEDHDRVNRSNAAVLTEQRTEPLEFRIVWPDGSIHFVWVEPADRVVDAQGKIVKLSGVMQDITERKQVEEELRQSERRHRRQARELSALNRAGRALTSTLELSKLLSLVIDEIKNLSGAEAASVLLYEPATEELRFAAVVGPESKRLENLSMPASAGAAGWVLHEQLPLFLNEARTDERFYAGIDQLTGLNTRSLIAVPLIQGDTPLGVIEAINNAGEAFSENDLILLEGLATLVVIALQNAQLYEAERAQYRRLRETQAQMVHVEKMAALGRLVASVAHEINNPLQAVQGCLGLTLEELQGKQRHAKMESYLQMATSELDRIGQILTRTRDFYRPAGEEKRPTDVHAILLNVVELSNKQLQHSRITLERDWDMTLPPIMANGDHLKQVFLNLVLNAIDALTPQGGTLCIRTRAAEITPPDRAAMPAVRIEFSDNGRGIPPEILPRVFEPFFTAKKGGSGLGLSISYGIIESHYGHITVTSEVGVGTTFNVLLPVAQP